MVTRIFSAPLSSRWRPQIVNLPSVSNSTGFMGSTGSASFTAGTSSANTHFFGSTVLLVAHCRKCSLFTSSLSTRMEVSGAEQDAFPELRLVDREGAGDGRADGRDALADGGVEDGREGVVARLGIDGELRFCPRAEQGKGDEKR